MGLPSGTKWSPVNLDSSKPSGFAETPFTYECSYASFGNIDTHNPTGSNTFSPWSWGSSPISEPYVTSPGATIQYPGSADLAHDVAYAVLGSPWRLPTKADFAELLSNSDYVDANGNIIASENKIITINNIKGIRLRSRLNGAIIFLACCGSGTSTNLSNVGTSGLYWSSDLNEQESGSALYIRSGGPLPSFSGTRSYGYAIRPVVRI